MSEEQIKHLEFIQAAITRMNTNSFQIKEWMITIVAALLALFASSLKETYIFVSIVPTLLFWLLDSYYLQQERKLRGVYNDAIKGKIPIFTIPINNYCKGEYRFCRVFWSRTIAWLYGSVSVMLLLGGLAVKYKLLL